MSRNYEKIDYQLRPAKAVERKMMAQLFARLSVLHPIEDYRYVGMGSVYFSDFALFHATCGFEKMISMEDESDPMEQARFKFNVPVGCIDLMFERTTKALPKLSWKEHSIVWLDYHGSISKDILSDLSYTASVVRSGSIVAVSVNAERHSVRNKVQLLAKLREAVGRDKVPAFALSVDTVERDTYIKVLYELLTAELGRAVTQRNSGADSDDKVIPKQLFYYTYEDGALMLTLGWLIVDRRDAVNIKLCRFSSFKHAKSGSEPFEIVMPKLTPAEMRAINRTDQKNKYEDSAKLPIPPEHVQRYRSLQPYWPMPSFAELV